MVEVVYGVGGAVGGMWSGRGSGGYVEWEG